MSLARVPSGAPLVDETFHQPVCQQTFKWLRQESNASTAVPGTPNRDFSRAFTPMESDSEHVPEAMRTDFYETRGSMASFYSSDQSTITSMEVDSTEQYEARGGIAFRTSAGKQVDPFEARGGLALLCGQPKLASTPSCVNDVLIDYEVRGGLSYRTAACQHADPYETRGGMGALAVQPLSMSQFMSNVPDDCEARGGLAYRK